MLDIENTILLVVDVQGNLAQAMLEKEELFKNLERIINGAKVLGVPIIWVEQNPDGLGGTTPQIAACLEGLTPVKKNSFSCCGNEEFIQRIKETGRTQVLISGIETHICIYQTTAQLIDLGYEVEVVTDAVSSRSAANIEIGINKMAEAGASLTSVETALFELLKVSGGDKFKAILKIVK
ncbi:MAG: hydrolase [Nitrospinota bacterium]